MARPKKGTSLDSFKKSLADGLASNQTDNYLEWVQKNKIVTEDGFPLDFTNRKFLPALFKDKGGYNGEGGKMAVMASAQVG